MTPGCFETVRAGAVEGSDTGEVLLSRTTSHAARFF
jgi:hypothetical protein